MANHLQSNHVKIVLTEAAGRELANIER